MNIKKEIQDTVKEETQKLKQQLKEIREAKSTRESLAELLSSYKFRLTMIWANRFDLHLGAVSEAKNLVNLLLDNTEIGRFEEKFDGNGSKPRWYYSAKLNGIELNIYPAPENQHCTPIEKEMPWHYWVCEKI